MAEFVSKIEISFKKSQSNYSTNNFSVMDLKYEQGATRKFLPQTLNPATPNQTELQDKSNETPPTVLHTTGLHSYPYRCYFISLAF